MATDFNYGNKTITAAGPVKPSIKNAPGDPRTRVNIKADIASIPVPYVGMHIYVISDETNNNKPQEYVVKSLKVNGLGVVDTVVDELVTLKEFLEIQEGGGSGSNITIVDNLTSTSTTSALSANQGRVIKSQLDESVRYTNTNTDGIIPEMEYYTKQEIDNMMGSSGVNSNINTKEFTLNLCQDILPIKGKYYDYSTGELKTLKDYGSSELIEVCEDTNYSKNITSHVTFWDKNGDFISGANAGNFKTPKGCKYVRFSAPLVKEGKIFMVQSDRATLGIPSYPYIKRYKPIGYNNNHNAEIPLLIETYDGTNQPTHPKLLSFNSQWNGYKYWLAYTPYPNGQPATENPCIAVSNDLYNWIVPNGLVNPIVPSPANAGMSNYNSDVHLVFNHDTNTLECWYREVYQNTTELIKRVTSTNGVTWSEPVVLKETVSGDVLKTLSPSIVYENGKYDIWVGCDGVVKKYESINGDNWVEKGNVVLNESDAINTWHFDVIRTIDGYELLNHIGRSENGTLTHFISYDGMSWSQSDFLMKPSENEKAFDYKGLYRSTFIKEQGKYVLIYACISKANKWQLALSKSDDDNITSLKGMRIGEAQYRNKPTKKNPLANELDSFYDNESGKILFYVNKNGTMSWVDFNGNII